MQPVALVTGASRGLGSDVCRELQKIGIVTVLTSLNEEEGLDAAARLREEQLDVFYQQLDVASWVSIEATKQYIQREFGRLDILINNPEIPKDQGLGGNPTPEAPFGVKADEIFRRTMDVNLYGVVRMCDMFAPMMKEQEFGRIVNVVCDLGELENTVSGYSAYPISQVAINGLTRTLAAELRDFPNIRVNSARGSWRDSNKMEEEDPSIPIKDVKNILWLATLPPTGPTGGFFRDGQPLPW